MLTDTSGEECRTSATNKCCGRCLYYRSYRDAYEDDLEPEDCGFCCQSRGYSKHVSGDETCDNFKKYGSSMK